MHIDILDKLTVAQKSRLEFIDFLLEFCGKVSRQWLTDCLQVGTASATRDIALYRQIAPNNSALWHVDKCHYRTEEFKPVFEHDTRSALANLTLSCNRLNHNPIGVSHNTELQYDTLLIYPSSSITAAVSRSIFDDNTICIDYESFTAGHLKREIVPHSIFQGYLGWYVRAFDKQLTQFVDFSLSRIQAVTELKQGEKFVKNTVKDIRWHTEVELSLIPHPSVQNPKAVELMYKMTNGCLSLKTNAVIAAHILQRENVVASRDDLGRLLSVKGDLEIDMHLDEL